MTGQHTDVGAYALGLLEPADRQEFERHLAGCPDCAAELAELAGMRAYHAGSLDNSAAAEALTSVLIFLNKQYNGHGGIRLTGLTGSGNA